MSKSKRTKACEISPKVRQEVEERDGHRCIFCKSYQCRGEAHFIGRAQGGLGIARNILTACPYCHRELDNGLNTLKYREIAREYLKSCYPDWNEEELVYNKWRK